MCARVRVVGVYSYTSGGCVLVYEWWVCARVRVVGVCSCTSGGCVLVSRAADDAARARDLSVVRAVFGVQFLGPLYRLRRGAHMYRTRAPANHAAVSLSTTQPLTCSMMMLSLVRLANLMYHPTLLSQVLALRSNPDRKSEHADEVLGPESKLDVFVRCAWCVCACVCV